jgi:hypothetical protein
MCTIVIAPIVHLVNFHACLCIQKNSRALLHWNIENSSNHKWVELKNMATIEFVTGCTDNIYLSLWDHQLAVSNLALARLDLANEQSEWGTTHLWVSIGVGPCLYWCLQGSFSQWGGQFLRERKKVFAPTVPLKLIHVYAYSQHFRALLHSTFEIPIFRFCPKSQ